MSTFGGDDGDYVECENCRKQHGPFKYEDIAHEWALANGWKWDERNDEHFCQECIAKDPAKGEGDDETT